MKNTIIYFCLFILSALVYYGAIYNDYSLDDEYIIVNNTNVQKGIHGIPNILTSPYSRQYDGARSSGYRPLSVVTAAIEYSFFGQNPKVSHGINVLLYSFSIILLFYFLQLIFGLQYPLLPIVATCLFLFHPIHSEVVINVKNRDELLAFLFAICTWISAIKASRTNGVSRFKWIMIGIIASFLSALSNPVFIVIIALTLPILYFFTNITFKGFFCFGILFLSLLGITKLLGHSIKKTDSVQLNFAWENPLYEPHTLFDTIGLALASLSKYIGLLLAPYPLSHYYGFNQIPIYTFTNPIAITCFLFFIGLIFVLTTELYKGKTLLGFTIAYFLIAILPFSNLFKYGPGIIAERWIYAASLAFSIAVASIMLKYTVGIRTTWQAAIAQQPNRLWILCLPLAIILSIYTVIIQKRIPNWKDMYTLSVSDVKTVPNSVKVNATVGSLLIPKFLESKHNDDIRQQAENYLAKALSIDSTYGPAWNNFGLFKESRGDMNNATKCFEKALLYKSIDKNAINNLGRAYVATGQYEKMINLYEQYLAQPEISNQLYSDYAIHLGHAGMLEKALAINDTAQKIMTDKLSIVYDNRARILYETGDKINALNAWEKAYQVDTTDPATAYKLMNAYLEIGDTAHAIKYKNIYNKNKFKTK